uniref:ORF-B n=1 Tax=Erysiphe necator umbra-like virus 2 TaxID=2695368 RepID=A0A7S5I078_9TOMB|nr:ORF-B [Erysiphe necator umbra-like virus 2]
MSLLSFPPPEADHLFEPTDRIRVNLGARCWPTEEARSVMPGVVPGYWKEPVVVGASLPKDRAPYPAAHPRPFVVRGVRLRPRSRQTANLEYLGRTVSRWWRDLPGASPAQVALAWIESQYAGTGLKVGSTHQIPASLRGEGDSPLPAVQVHFSSEEGERWLWVAPELTAYLFNYRLYRPISDSLLASLRSRARLWAEDNGVSVMDLARVLPGSLMLACTPTPDEVVSLGALRGSAAQWSREVLGALSKGKAMPTTRGGSWWDVLKPSLRFGGTQGSILGGAGCAPINMVA